MIDADLHLLGALARLLAWLIPRNRLRPVEVVAEYHKTLLDELNLIEQATAPSSSATSGINLLYVL